jgi:hypothetical protein
MVFPSQTNIYTQDEDSPLMSPLSLHFPRQSDPIRLWKQRVQRRSENLHSSCPAFIWWWHRMSRVPLRTCLRHIPYVNQNSAYQLLPIGTRSYPFYKMARDIHSVLEDNQPAINLTTAPQVTRRSRHKEHYIRWLYKSKQICPKFIGTNDMLADGLTKSLAPSKFLWFQNQLFGHEGPHS